MRCSKLIGFSDSAVLMLVLFESLVLCVVAAGVGLTLAAIIYPNSIGSAIFSTLSAPITPNFIM